MRGRKRLRKKLSKKGQELFEKLPEIACQIVKEHYECSFAAAINEALRNAAPAHNGIVYFKPEKEN